MKRLVILVTLLLVSCPLFAQDPDIFGTPSLSSPKDLVGQIVVPLEYKGASWTDSFLNVPEDTIWKKKVPKPKPGKHYTIKTDYDGPFVGQKFKVLEVDDNIRNERKSILFESLADGRVFRFESLILSHLEVLDLPEVSSKLTKQFRGEVFYAPASKYSASYLDDLKPVVIDSLSYQCRLGSSKRFVTVVNAHYEDGSDFICDSSDKGYNSIISEAEYKERVHDKEIRKLNAGKYSLFLAKVNRSSNLKGAKGTISELGGVQSVYEDSFIKIAFVFSPVQFEFVLNNKTDNSMKLNWDEALFINEKNESQRVVHKGIRYMDASKPQAPTIVARGSKIEELLIPADNIHYSSYAGEWVRDNILPNSSTLGRFDPDDKMILIIPIESNGKVYEYTFTFGLEFSYLYPEFREQYLNSHPEIRE